MEGNYGEGMRVRGWKGSRRLKILKKIKLKGNIKNN